MIICPHCNSTDRQVKAGLSRGKQRYKCQNCLSRYTPQLSGDTIGRAFSRAQTAEASPAYGGAKGTPFHYGDGAGQSSRSAARRPLSAGKRRPTITDVARRAGVSTATVSNYINGKGRIGNAARSRVATAIDELHYTPSALVQAIRQRRTCILGVLIFGLTRQSSDVTISLSPPLLQGMNRGAEDAQHHLLLYSGWPDREDRFSKADFLNGHVDGLIWVAPRLTEPMLDQVANAGLPVVALLTRQAPEGVGYIHADNTSGIRTLVRGLHDLGHRRIAYVGPVYNSDFFDRREAFRDIISDLKLEIDPKLEFCPVVTAAEDPAMRDGVSKMIAMKRRPTAIVTADDGYALAIVDLIRQSGMRVPEDISICGFNDIPATSPSNANVTTVRQPFQEIGRLGVNRLVALIEGAPVEECRIALPCEVVWRGSTGPAPSSA